MRNFCQIYFEVETPESGAELWVTNGTTGGTTQVKDLNPGVNGSAPNKLTVWKNKLYFSADNGTNDRELYVYTPQPIFSDFSPKYGDVGDEVLLYGLDLGDSTVAKVVKFNGLNAEIISSGNDSIRVKVPENVTTGKISLETKGMTLLSSQDFVFKLTHTVTSFSPKSGKTSDVVTITGTDFSPVLSDNFVKFNGISAKVVSASATELQAEVPANATTGKISVTINNNEKLTNEDFVISLLTSLPQTFQNAQLTLFPNPAKNMLKLKLGGKATSQVNITAYNLLGKPVLQSSQTLQNGETKVDISSLPSGNYILKIQVGEEVISRKIMKQ